MLIAVTTLAALSFLFASLLVLAHRKLHVDEDPRIDAAFQMLPQTNCGACGFPGCRGLAEAIVAGDNDDIMRRLDQYIAAGASKFILRPIGEDDADILAQTQRLIDETLPAVAGLNKAA